MGFISSLFSTPKVPVVPPAAAPATMAQSSVANAAAQARTRAAAAASVSGTQATGPQGLVEKPKTAGTTLLGG